MDYLVRAMQKAKVSKLPGSLHMLLGPPTEPFFVVLLTFFQHVFDVL